MNKLLKSTLCLWLLSCFLCFSLCGCGKEEASIPNEPIEELPETASEVEEVEFEEEAPEHEETTNEEVPSSEISEEELYANPSGMIDNVDDKIIFNDGGVSIEFDKFTIDESQGDRLSFTVKNDNPDNKKVILSNPMVNLNGLCSSGREIIVNGTGDYSIEVLNGDTVSCSVIYGHDSYKNVLDQLDCPNMPIETINIALYVAIGSDSNPVCVKKTMKTDDFNETDMQNLFGTLVGSTSMPGANTTDEVPVDVYYKENSSGGNTAILVNKGDDTFSWDGLGLYVKDRLLVAPNVYGDPGPLGSLVLRNDETDDDIRRANEISNNDKLKIVVNSCYYIGMQEGFTLVEK